jgi:putative FmdB family regulatory protein
MPLYEYRCDHCGKHFDVLQKFSDQPLTVHEECGSGPVERLVSAPAFHFKGSGWYVTDYAKTNGNSAPAKTDGDSKSESKSESKGEGKPESGSETKKTETKKSETKKTESSSSPAPAASSTESK